MLKLALFGLLAAAASFPRVARCAQNHGAGEIADLPQITVRLYNYAAASEATLIRAQQQASQILLEAGVSLSWLQCTLDKQGLAADPRCHEIRGPAALWMRICPKEMVPEGGLVPGVFGFSLMPEQGPAMTAWVYFHRVEELADRIQLCKGGLLGSMMAHELGHLLLGINSHSRVGIMSLPWALETVRQASQGRLSFTPEQAARIQFEARRRLGR
jgi:hypothetical protein